MILLRLSGHSGAGKTRLVNSLQKFGIYCPKVLRYTSRHPRIDEVHGQDYFFMSRAFIESLPEEDFLVGPVRNMLQAFDLRQLETDLKMNNLVLIEIYPDLWPKLIDRMKACLGEKLKTVSVFMTAVDPTRIVEFADDTTKAEFISREVEKIIRLRNKDEEADVLVRSAYAAKEVLEALSPEGCKMYNKIIHSAPEGPDGEDDWTREREPVGRAKKALEEFIELIKRYSG